MALASQQVSLPSAAGRLGTAWPGVLVYLLIQAGAAPKAAFARQRTHFKNKAVLLCPEKGTRLQTARKNELLDVSLYGK